MTDAAPAPLEEFALACWDRAQRLSAALHADWAGQWAALGAGMRQTPLFMPWAGMPPLGALAQADPDGLEPSHEALALSVAFGAALEPQSSSPLWNRAFLEACALCWASPPQGFALRRFERLCQQGRSPGQAFFAHDPALPFADELARALLRSARPDSLLQAASDALGSEFWRAQVLEGFHRDFRASFAERLACRMLACGLDPDPHPAKRSQALSRLAASWNWLRERGEISPQRCADCLADKAGLAEMAWARPGREGGPRAWRQACQAAWGEQGLARFARELARAGAAGCALALGPTAQDQQRRELSIAIDQAQASESARRL